MSSTLLIEIFTEELPPKALEKLGNAFASGIFNGLKARDFLNTDAIATTYATPRRLAVIISNVRAVSLDKTMREKVLPVSVALDTQGQPSVPLIKKLAALAAATNAVLITPDQLERAVDGKAESFFYSYTAKGAALETGLQVILDDTVAKLPIPKQMSYQLQYGPAAGETVHFVRPAHRLIVLHGDAVVPLRLLGLNAGRITGGHRFLSKGAITIANAESYVEVLASQGKVIASFSQRKEQIRTALLAAAGGDQVLMPESLLDEVTALVEWPVVYPCHFEDEYLTVPQECLILTMQTNQKYFALTDATGKLRSRFLIVSNLETKDPQYIIQGNERVVRPRLADAKFFFEQDQKKTLADRVPLLANVVYHNKLGNQFERTQRVQTIAVAIATLLSSDPLLAVRAARGAELAKADLLTDMVGEFPELQGIMGTYYARHDGEADQVALAISEHYQPRFAGDALPTTDTSTAVALADKLETLVGIWGIGLQPTGDKDPFALRRHALGVLRMLLEKRLPLSLQHLLQTTAASFADNANFKDPGTDVLSFMYDRLRGILRERGYAPNQIEAVVAQQPDTLTNIIERLDAVQAFAALPEAEALAGANKRITNILKKNNVVQTGAVQANLLQDAAEKNLVAAMTNVKPQVDAAFAQGDFAGALQSLARLRSEVDAFFNEVMVMAEDEQLRNNRLALLSNLHLMLNQVADISKLVA
ncbi:glycine--tRNA ligase subunit beta [Glaciimonas sp. CA11.2]|uniref:glycine--tRNA ligase subunit beta n=1 Tax=unclassified Glaciimonas TaxID=2644401 RepID=UPI002AB5CF24|nr:MULTISPECIES: glycine--tRNA ligase subunit beta [unclassified Glaciimonas]MDY7545141.1 glycine--tRNA ligase subunit beta [Glaciimonas sp. CA11.2]MEB0011361.1 glycine--tRNA ligase subunit beta [Glaciimonas sp. Cout2]MEB0081011.1 glycine--tRNA ligase subunit beta [Glaciimonas sp. Gout2]MEB0162861.1 glycine--tRNA ligase subunit beta [Glaciimonas sp. CA11.2]